MSRIRSIHPGLWTDEQFVSLSSFARLLFMGIWNECDDKGTFPWSPLQMKMRILPADNVDAAELMSELEQCDCIQKYEIDGKAYGAVRNFAKFQRPKAPNDIHPATAEVLAFAGHASETPNPKPKPLPKDLPKASEKPPQMEEGEEDVSLEPEGSCASSDALKPGHIFDEWNVTVAGLTLPAVRDRTPTRTQLVKARIAQYSLEDFVTVFGKVKASDFLAGRTERWKGATFDWVMKRSNFVKILEGNYDG